MIDRHAAGLKGIKGNLFPCSFSPNTVSLQSTFSKTLQLHLTTSPYNHTFQPHLSTTPYNHTLQPHLTTTPYNHTLQPQPYNHTLQPHLNYSITPLNNYFQAFKMNNFTVHFDFPIIRANRLLIRATYGDVPFHIADFEEAVGTARVIPTPSGGIELIKVTVNGEVVAFELDPYNAVRFHDYITGNLPRAPQPAPMTRAQEEQALFEGLRAIRPRAPTLAAAPASAPAPAPAPAPVPAPRPPMTHAEESETRPNPRTI
ncbi:hypothetical protein OCU04_003779 [Sclerotinia nivalis]|uniref:Uncharacterized protein n=1 Tax=Sclerotinia nivalis TaxID=352851 RepID=A0A9X0ASM7_9HELO|nr:hypothetical protein OCU04_003779 [Sclerotinia nivalis]